MGKKCLSVEHEQFMQGAADLHAGRISEMQARASVNGKSPAASTGRAEFVREAQERATKLAGEADALFAEEMHSSNQSEVSVLQRRSRWERLYLQHCKNRRTRHSWECVIQ